MKGLLQQRDILQHPAIDCGMVDLDAPFFHHLLELTVADRICDVPAHAPEDDVPLKMAALKIDHRGLSPSEMPTIRPRDRVGQNLATEPVFGGGTALARAHRIIRRMSEDVDFKLVPRPAAAVSRSALRRQIEKLRAQVSAALKDAGFVFDPADRS